MRTPIACACWAREAYSGFLESPGPLKGFSTIIPTAGDSPIPRFQSLGLSAFKGIPILTFMSRFGGALKKRRLCDVASRAIANRSGKNPSNIFLLNLNHLSTAVGAIEGWTDDFRDRL